MDTTTAPSTLIEPLDAYVDRLIVEKNFPDLTDEVRAQVKKDLLDRLNDTINAKVIAALSDSDLAGFEKLLDANAPQEEIQKYIESKVPDSTTFLANVLLDFRKTYLGIV